MFLTSKGPQHPFPLYLDSLWVNLQQKHEFNPVHDHSGIFSFVIWLQIPYTRVDEHQSPGYKSNSPCSGNFNFFYTNALGDIVPYSMECNITKENVIYFFPSKMKHSVYPFYSTDDYRITVSGNFKMKV